MSTWPADTLHTQSRQHALASPAALRWGQHVVTAILLAMVLLRGLAGAQHTWPVIGAVVLFAGWYALGFVLLAASRTTPLPAWWLAILLTCWVATLAVSPEFIWLAFSLWLLIGHQLPFAPSILCSVAVYALTILAPYLHQVQPTPASVVGPLVGGIFAWGISRGYLQLEKDAQERTALVESLVRAHHDMSNLQEELARSQHEAGVAAERTRLAREIHDTVAQQLSSIGLQAKAALTADNPRRQHQALSRIDDLAGASLSDLRRIIAALAPAELDSQALAEALERLLSGLRRDTGTSTRLNLDPGVPALDPGIQIVLLRIAQSALSNVRRHAQASTVSLSLGLAGGEVRLDIVDDGCGFRLEKIPRTSQAGGFGLVAMSARLRELGGGLDIESSPGQGTALCAHIPLHQLKDNT
ncbi:sensor histidine kinase [Glutamicibacter sp. NPDC087344]|uniref:sensor histidine kinase n=1 Tax=Glutamicibacter sp. NPDC087344 TaxID=3363994 RepID=UPI003810C3AB